MNRFVLVYFAAVLALFAGSCGDYGTCPSGPDESFAIADGEYRYVPERSGELEHGRPVFGTLRVDTDARTADVEYERTARSSAKSTSSHRRRRSSGELSGSRAQSNLPPM